MKLEGITSALTASQELFNTKPLLLFKISCLLPSTQFLDDCATSLATDPQHRSDTTLIHMIRGLRLAEETTHTFDHGSKEKIGELSDEKLQVLVEAQSGQIEAWREGLPLGVFHGTIEYVFCSDDLLHLTNAAIGRIQRSYYSTAVGAICLRLVFANVSRARLSRSLVCRSCINVQRDQKIAYLQI